MTDDQIEAAMATGQLPEGVTFETPTVSEPGPVAEPEPAPEPAAVESPAEEPKIEPAQEPAETLDPEDIRARLEASDARAKHWEAVAGRTGGRLGFLEQQFQKMQSAPQRPVPIEEANGYDEAPRPQPVQPPPDDPIRAWAMQQSAIGAVSSFTGKYPDAHNHAQAMGDYVQSTGFNPESVMASGDPQAAGQQYTRILEEAYWHAKAIEADAVRVARQQKRAEQTSAVIEAKKRASVSATASTPPPKPRPKTPNEMTDTELEAEMIQSTGGRW
jgi:hypothetical protein